MQNYHTGRNPLALVADDDQGMRLLIREALELSGFAVIEAEDGSQALELFDCHRPDIVMLDVMMSEMGGVAACAALRSRPAGMRVPILMVTGLDDASDIT